MYSVFTYILYSEPENKECGSVTFMNVIVAHLL